jgi:hypothetical protein
MKKNILFLTISILALLGACKKEDTADVSKVASVSYPLISLKGAPGDTVIFLATGSTYTDAGATLTDDITGAISDLTGSTAEVDLSTPGVYYVTFSASNANGFETTKNRVIVVYDASVPAEDFTGTYSHATGGIVSVNKVADRLFTCDDLYGTFTIPIPLYFVDFGTGLYIPSQRIHPSLGVEIHGEGEKTGTAGSYVLDFYGLIRDGLERPRTLTQQ